MGSQEDIGKKIKEIRQRSEMTQLEVAEKAGIHVNYYARIERGEIVPSWKILDKLAKIFKVDLNVTLR